VENNDFLVAVVAEGCVHVGDKLIRNGCSVPEAGRRVEATGELLMRLVKEDQIVRQWLSQSNIGAQKVH